MSDILKWLQDKANEEWEYEDGDYFLEAIKQFTRLRADLAAIRPHIEAAERERCAKIADKYVGEWHSDLADACARAIATEIRSGK